MAKRPANKDEKEHMRRVAALGCYIWNNFPDYRNECGGRAEVHHQLGVVRSHHKTMCLCTFHHSAQTPLPHGYAVHKGTKSFEARYTTQAKMVEDTINELTLTQGE